MVKNASEGFEIIGRLRKDQSVAGAGIWRPNAAIHDWDPIGCFTAFSCDCREGAD